MNKKGEFILLKLIFVIVLIGIITLCIISEEKIFEEQKIFCEKYGFETGNHCFGCFRNVDGKMIKYTDKEVIEYWENNK